MTKQELLSVIARKTPFGGKIKMESKLQEDLGFDSAMMMDLVLSLEDWCGIRFPDEALNMASMSTPRKLWELIDRLKNT